MISSLYNRENGVKAGLCVATANEPNTICRSASALEGDEFGCVPYVEIGGRMVIKRQRGNQMTQVRGDGQHSTQRKSRVGTEHTLPQLKCFLNFL